MLLGAHDFKRVKLGILMFGLKIKRHWHHSESFITNRYAFPIERKLFMELYLFGGVVLVGGVYLLYLLHRVVKATEAIAATRDYLVAQIDEIKDLLKG